MLLRSLRPDEYQEIHRLYCLYDRELFYLHCDNSGYWVEPESWYLDKPICITVIEENESLIAFCIYSVQAVFEDDVDAEILDI